MYSFERHNAFPAARLIEDFDFDLYSAVCPMDFKMRVLQVASYEPYKMRGTWKISTLFKAVRNREDLAFVLSQIRDAWGKHTNREIGLEMFAKWLKDDINSELEQPFRLDRFESKEIVSGRLGTLAMRIGQSDLPQVIDPDDKVAPEIISETITCSAIFLACMRAFATTPGSTHWHSLRANPPGGTMYSLNEEKFFEMTGVDITKTDVWTALNARSIMDLDSFGKFPVNPIESTDVTSPGVISVGPTQIFCNTHNNVMQKAYVVRQYIYNNLMPLFVAAGISQDEVIGALDSRLNFYLDQNAKDTMATRPTDKCVHQIEGAKSPSTHRRN